eukprot:gene58773-78418_t
MTYRLLSLCLDRPGKHWGSTRRDFILVGGQSTRSYRPAPRATDTRLKVADAAGSVYVRGWAGGGWTVRGWGRGCRWCRRRVKLPVEQRTCRDANPGRRELLFRRSWTRFEIYDVAAQWRGDRLHLGQVRINRDP